MKKHLMSRKFLIALTGVISGLLTMFGFSDSSSETIVGAILTLISIATYVIVEGRIDRASVMNGVDAIIDITEEVKEQLAKAEVEGEQLKLEDVDQYII